eukprot:CAMPEP_0194143248 /NCGR_PEP_ID=MMETSP0152-20130528/12433_1 /TAXON_ID=1049557 /ORGANISM="Thalassiothrix antarctica, Strain L6-D1" /LENGTH=115 /DNA_ID=CAMNT_0038842565 /DNA_START=336 /DNA_END=680 /DNA_ORIENTATION=+
MAMGSMILVRTVQQMVFVSVVLGGANGMYLTMDTSLAVDTLRLSSTNNNDTSHKKENAQLLGVWGVAGFIGTALGPLVGGPLLYIFGKTDEEVDGEMVYSIRGYGVVLGLSAFYY